ncbi:hypothetical protein [Baia soyae]|uniref:Uncharacterized protein n=1 Tax=Baia soyae TaxID=1544746 RepID=A0A4R2RDD8_9BACL|nr:hypothetical protein [Baia soyae]TCP60823.1 hypothetical protein EDD57_1676 [Baia soyae]
MLKLQVEGSREKIKSFMDDVHRNPSVKVLEQETGYKIKDGEVQPCVKCSIDHIPERRMSLIQIITTDGQKIEFKMFDMVQAAITEGIKVFAGRSVDIFSVIQEEKEAFRLWKKLRETFEEKDERS